MICYVLDTKVMLKKAWTKFTKLFECNDIVELKDDVGYKIIKERTIKSN